MFNLFGRKRLVEQIDKQQQDIIALTLQVERSFVEFKAEIRSLRTSIEREGTLTEKELDRMAKGVEKLEKKFTEFAHGMQREHRKFGESDVRHSEQIISLFKIAERANLVSNEDRQQLNMYIQTNSGNGQGNQGQDINNASNGEES